MNRVETLLKEMGTPPLPFPGFDIEAGRTAVVITDPQNDFLHPDGVAWGACGGRLREGATSSNQLALPHERAMPGAPREGAANLIAAPFASVA